MDVWVNGRWARLDGDIRLTGNQDKNCEGREPQERRRAASSTRSRLRAGCRVLAARRGGHRQVPARRRSRRTRSRDLDASVGEKPQEPAFPRACEWRNAGRQRKAGAGSLRMWQSEAAQCGRRTLKGKEPHERRLVDAAWERRRRRFFWPLKLPGRRCGEVRRRQREMDGR